MRHRILPCIINLASSPSRNLPTNSAKEADLLHGKGSRAQLRFMDLDMGQGAVRYDEVLVRAGQGDSQALGEAFARHRDRLRRMVQLRMDRRLHGRLDPSDVLQEAYLEFSRSLADYLRKPEVPFFVW